MTPKDNELRMQVGLVITHTDDELLFTKSEKYANTLDALQAFAELVRQEEREACAKLCESIAKPEENIYYTAPLIDIAIAAIRGRTE
jgi:hypothetical protein